MQTLTTIKEIKQTIKNLGAEIRKTRLEHKENQRSTGYGFESSLERLINDYRSLHIAYGLIRGKEYKQIEKKTREGNEPNWTKINNHISDFQTALELREGN